MPVRGSLARMPRPSPRKASFLFSGLAAAALLSLPACGGPDAPSRAGIARVARESKARLARVQRFRPPADGLVTDAMLERYIRVRRGAKGRPDGDTARAIGVDPDEAAWVRARVDEALIEVDGRRVRAASEEVYARTIASLRETRRSVKDAATARAIDDQIVGLERERATLRRPSTASASVAANARKVAAHRSDLDGLSGP